MAKHTPLDEFNDNTSKYNIFEHRLLKMQIL